jgi:hypothetical protein
MTRICVQAKVPQSAATTERLLEAYVRSGGENLALAHDVVIHFRKVRDADDLADVFFVNGTPPGDGPYPTFSGVMNVYPETDRRHSRLELDGAYSTPSGVLGRDFDATAGSTIARSSLVDLIERLAADLTSATSKRAG